ncbi:hypothetical protein GCM10009737_01020 [Nocardioides lentus]|uniref:Uncharacterized protein n=1 Tax=Nocardioides lentus TaxID=338077 RepID=A0ABP5A7H5_9ACTN
MPRLTLLALGLLATAASACGDQSRPAAADVEVCAAAVAVVEEEVLDQDAQRDRVDRVADQVTYARLTAPVREVAGLPDVRNGSTPPAAWRALLLGCDDAGLLP